jgi:hypothetical protein
MKHLIGGSKDQWPPVGKSSDTPKEVKNARREELPPVIGKPANMGLDVFITSIAYPLLCSDVLDITAVPELMLVVRVKHCSAEDAYAYMAE